MQTKAVLSALQKYCDARVLPQTLTALRHDSLVWEALAKFDFDGYGRRQAEKQGDDLWTPAGVALFALETELTAEGLRREPMAMLEGNLLRRALAVFEETLRTGRRPADLREAALLALALRERRRKMRSWVGLGSDLTLKGELANDARIEPIWNSALACLYGLIPDRAEFLKALLADHPARGMGWCIHILLCNPATEDEQARALAGLMIDASLETQAAWLQRIQFLGRDSLAEKIARVLLAASQPVFDGLKKQFAPAQSEMVDILAHAAKLQHAAAIYRSAGASLQSAGLLEKAQSLLSFCLAGVQFQQAALDAEDRKPDAAATRVEKAFEINQDGAVVERGAAVLHETGLLDVEIPSMDREPGFLPALYLARQMAAGGNSELARQTASRAVEEWLSQQKAADIAGDWKDEKPLQTLDTLAAIELIREAGQCAQVFLARRPNDLQLLHRAAQIAEKDGDADRAIACRETMVLLAPQDVQARRELARLQEDQKLWEMALVQRRAILNGAEHPAVEDQFALANCAIHAGEVGTAMEVCDQILAAQPEHGIAHTIKGQALLQLGQVEDAVSHLSRATLLCSDQPRPWLALAEAQQKNGEPQRALDTLRAAILAVPESAGVHFQLARLLLDQGFLTDALPYLRQAARLSPEAASVTTELAKTLRQLGHQSEALRILAEARSRWPKDPQLAYLEALTLQDLGHRQKALDSLEVAIRADQPQIDWLRSYAQMQVQDPETLYTAMPADFDPVLLQRLTQTLQKILAISPTDFTARMWMADLLRLRGQEQLAFDAYRQLLDECGDQDETLHLRAQAGFGAAALAANQLDTAMACLQEVLQATPENLGAMHLLAEAYFKLDLPQETARAADQALQMEPDQVNNLIWYSGVMERLGRLEEAQRALGTAVQLSPERGDLWLKQAQYALASGRAEAAQKLLAELEELPNVTGDELNQAARIHIQLKAYPQALSTLKRLESQADSPSGGLLCDLAFLSQHTGDFQGAMAYAERAVQSDEQNIRLHVLQADLLAQQGRTQAALACLEKAGRLMENKPLAEKHAPQSGAGLFAAEETLFAPAAVYARSATLLKEQGDIQGASFYAEKALEILPGDSSIRLLACQLAYSQLQFERVLELTAAEEPAAAPRSLLNDRAGDCWQALQAMRCELLLDAGNEVDASAIVNGVQERGELQPRMKAIQMRLLARNGEYEPAEVLFDEAVKLEQGAARKTGQAAEPIFGNLYRVDPNEYAAIWLGRAAQDLYRWDASDRLFDQGREKYAREAIGHYQFAGALVRRAKAARLTEAVRAETHGPQPRQDQAGLFENALLSTSQYSGSPRISELRQVGKLVLQANQAQFKRVLTEGHPPSDREALVIALAQSGNLPMLIQVAEQAKEQPEVCAQAAVSLMATDAGRALTFAQQAVELEPRQPLYHALRAMILSKTGRPAEVMETWQTALQFWPNEPCWQAELAQMSQVLGDPAATIRHWDAAFKLQPKQAGYAFNLGNAYLENRNFSKAIDAFETASRLDPRNPQIWLAMAEAQLRGGHLERALQCAQRAAAIEPESLHAMLLQGEILIEMGNLMAAQEISDQALQRGSSIPEVVVFNVHLLVKRDKVNEALAVLEQAAGLLKNEATLQLERAALIRQIYGSTAALPVIQEIAGQYPENNRALAMLATIRYECGDAAGAEKAAQQALRSGPDQSNLHLLMGQIKAAGGQLDQAVYHLSEAVQLNPADVEGYLELGKVYQERREQEKAILTFQQAIKISPRDTRAYVLAAAAMRDAKDYSAAEKLLRKAAELAPTDLNIRRQLGAVIALNLVQHSQEAQAWH